MFPEDLLALILEQLACEVVAVRHAVPPRLAVDTYVARSILQKAIRRGLIDLALRAAATLFHADRRTLWRRLLVTALEDIGVGETDLVARIVAAGANRTWRESVGGDWPVLSTLIASACNATHCQSANDLWNVARNDPALDSFKASVCEASLAELLDILRNDAADPIHRGVAVLLVLGEDAGPSAPRHIETNPGTLFEAFAEAGRYRHVVAIYETAFRHSRLALAPLTLCLWASSRVQAIASTDVEIPEGGWIGDVPAFALDQYTRPGLAAIRAFTAESATWRAYALSCGVSRSDWTKAAGELLFRAEGALLVRRRAWSLGLDLYARSLPMGCFVPPDAVSDGLTLISRELPLIDKLRAQSLHTTLGQQSCP